ncbi:hypothetical protein [Krasilnikovia sp. M28-CT-15]|uniref:hypothetical protein n=1 Tax=Krasilnikovia sp. M28-CT-15 TaxID=3373540 RepID=UPI003875F349
MSDLKQRFAALADDADQVAVAPAGELRTRADRRARSRAVVATLALAVVVGGTATGGRWLFTAGGPAVPPQPAGSTQVTAPPSNAPEPSLTNGTKPPDTTPPSSGTPVRSDVPDRAFLTLAETRAEEPYTVDTEDQMPELCGARFPSDGAVQSRRTVLANYKGPHTPADNTPDGTVMQTITVYGGGGAQDFIREFQAAVRGCPKKVKGDVTIRPRLLPAPSLGDEAVLVERKVVVDVPPGEFGAGEHVWRTAVVRAGDAVTVLNIQGWEGASIDPAETTTLTRQAAERLANWRR